MGAVEFLQGDIVMHANGVFTFIRYHMNNQDVCVVKSDDGRWRHLYVRNLVKINKDSLPVRYFVKGETILYTYNDITRDVIFVKRLEGLNDKYARIVENGREKHVFFMYLSHKPLSNKNMVSMLDKEY